MNRLEEKEMESKYELKNEVIEDKDIDVENDENWGIEARREFEAVYDWE